MGLSDGGMVEIEGVFDKILDGFGDSFVISEGAFDVWILQVGVLERSLVGSLDNVGGSTEGILEG